MERWTSKLVLGTLIHEYLQSIVNPLVKANYDKRAAKLRDYLQAGRSDWY